MKKINFGIVNNYFIFSREELETVKSKMTNEEIEFLKEAFSDSYEDYKDSQKSVIFTKEGLKDVNLNDYVSLSPYWWPDPQKEDGLPYIRNDGVLNPESNGYDKSNFEKLAFDVYHLSLLYYLTDDKTYYEIMKKNIYYYLLDKETGMNPNLNHAQTVKGQDNGRCYGIIEYTVNFSLSLHLLNLIYEMGYVEDDFKNDLNVWVKEFLNWMTTSPLGVQERDGNNNHAIYWDFGTIVLCDFLHDDSMILELYNRVVNYRVKLQVTGEGAMPFELYRTRSISYSIMASKGLYNFSKVAAKYGYSLWDNEASRKKLTAIANYLFDRLIYKKKPWLYMQIIEQDSVYMISLMYEAMVNISQDFARFDLIDKLEVQNTVAYLIGSKLF